MGFFRYIKRLLAVAVLLVTAMLGSAIQHLDAQSFAATIRFISSVANIPPASAYPQQYGYVTDLGGGADVVFSDGISWKHIREGTNVNIPATGTITQTPLLSPLIITMMGSNVLTTVNINVTGTSLYQGYAFTLRVPASVLGVTGALAIQLNGVPVSGLPVINNGTWADYQYDGTSIVKLRGGTL